MKEGDRVRVIRTGTTGVIKRFGSLPGVPVLVNVAYAVVEDATTSLRNWRWHNPPGHEGADKHR
jgi:hypothetical protein